MAESKEYTNPAFEVGDEGAENKTPAGGENPDEIEKTNENLSEPPVNKEKRGSGGGFNLLKPSNSDSFLALARRASNASRTSDEEGANGVGERGLKPHDSSGSLKLPEQERSVPIPGAGRRSSLADIAITLHTQSRGFFEGGVLYAGDAKKSKNMFIHPYGNRNPEEDEDDFENLLNLKKKKHMDIQPANPSALFAWLVVAGFMVGMACVIIFGSETAGSSTYFKRLLGLLPEKDMDNVIKGITGTAAAMSTPQA